MLFTTDVLGWIAYKVFCSTFTLTKCLFMFANMKRNLDIQMRTKRTVLQVILHQVRNASVNSFNGFKSVYKTELAFRLELFVTLALFPFGMLISTAISEWFALLAASLLVLLTETVNTAIETVVDRISLETHNLSKRAKDLGSLSVTFALIIYVITWLYLIFG